MSEVSQLFEQVSEFSDVAFWLADPHRPAILFMSPAYEGIWGRPVAELSARPQAYLEAISPEDRSDVERSLEALLAGRPIDIRYRVLRPDGTVRWVRTRAVGIRDEQGRINRTTGINEDITESHVRSESDRAFLAALDQATLAGVAAVDVDGTQTYVNPAFCRMLGWEASELVGRRPPFLYWPPEELDNIQAALGTTLTGRTPPEGHFVRFMRKSGERFDVQLLLAPLVDAAGKVTGWVASASDVSPLTRAQERLRQSQGQLEEAQRLAHLGSWEWDIRANRITWSDELYRIYGLGPGEVPASYEAYLHILHPDDRVRANEVIQAALASRSPFDFEHRIRRPNGEVRTLHGRGVVVSDARGVPVRMVGTGLDITERKLADEARYRLHQEQEARRVAEEGLRTRDDFLSVAAHELRTPLTSLRLQVQMLARESQDEGSARLEKIDRQLTRVDRLVNTLLDVSRSLSGRMTLEPERMDLAEVVRDVLDRATPVAAQAGSPVRLEASATAVGVWDRLRLEQAVENLVLNALKYGAGKPVEVSLLAEASGVRFSVRDHGIGIAPEDQRRIFERFERAVSARNFGGFGLGLWITRQVIDAHGGRIEVESELGQGATFRVWLPPACPPPG